MELTAGFKMSEAGPIPKDWEAVRFESVAAKSRNAIVGGPFGSDLTSDDYQVAGVPVIRGSNMHGRHVHGPFVYVGSAKAKALEANLARGGDVVFTQRGTLGQVALVPNDGYDAYLISQSQMKASLDPEACVGEFIVQVFEQPEYQRKIVASSIQTGVPHLNLGILRGYVVPQPPLREQRAIAEVLGDVDDWIVAAEAETAKLAAVKAAAMDALLNPTTRLPGFDGAWILVSVGDAAVVMQGGTPSTAVSAFWGGGIPWCTPTDITAIQGNELCATERTISEAGLQACAAKLLPVGSVLLCTRATVGEAKIAAVPVATNQGFRSLVARSNIDPTFLFYAVLTLKASFIERASGSTFLEISKTDVEATPMRIPPTIAEQRAIATVLSDIDAALATARAAVAKAKGVKAAAMEALLSGRVRLPRDLWPAE